MVYPFQGVFVGLSDSECQTKEHLAEEFEYSSYIFSFSEPRFEFTRAILRNINIFGGLGSET